MTDTKHVQIERTFDAPIDLIWAMWTEPEHFANWYGPMGAKIPKADMDVRVGGRRHIAMEMDTPRGLMQMYLVGEYREVHPKTRLVYTEAMADADIYRTWGSMPPLGARTPSLERSKEVWVLPVGETR
jgi:uncharacterized protein YndB with AHSA1/START domain